MADQAPQQQSDPTTVQGTPSGDQTQTPPQPAGDDFDHTKLTPEQLNKVLENPNLWKTPRMVELREQAARAKKLEQDQATAADKALAEQNKFKELAEKRGTELETYQTKVKNLTIDQALTTKLSGAGVIDLDGALKLVDRSKIDVTDNGVDGVEAAIEALKTDKPYLFNAQTTPVGSPTNPTNGAPTGAPGKFKSSQITPEFYATHEKEILEAYAKGLVEDDGPPPQ
jgi:hypothetical protein